MLLLLRCLPICCCSNCSVLLPLRHQRLLNFHEPVCYHRSQAAAAAAAAKVGKSPLLFARSRRLWPSILACLRLPPVQTLPLITCQRLSFSTMHHRRRHLQLPQPRPLGRLQPRSFLCFDVPCPASL